MMKEMRETMMKPTNPKPKHYRFPLDLAYADPWPGDTVEVHGVVMTMGPDGQWHETGTVYTHTLDAPKTVRSA